ncbi:MAG TPA: motility protein MotB, partial [Betaproteobacteria bacterium]|nr:motility protein MotB [Betaproteobacteria bacterium]
STVPVEKRSFKIPPIQQAQEKKERAREKSREKAKLKALKARLEKMIAQNPLLKKFEKQILIDITPEGLRIQIVDEKNRPMFALGSAVIKPYMMEILHEIGKVLNEVPNKLSISGHTDATHYSGGQKGYSNWELSTDRANASRRELIRGGMAESKVLRVVGLASAVPFDPKNPFNPVNRRITLIVLNKQTEERIMQESAQPSVTDVPSLAEQDGRPFTENAPPPAPVAAH